MNKLTKLMTRRYTDGDFDLLKELGLVSEQRDAMARWLDVAEGALEQVAMPRRPDGTYNRSREACEQLAREALAFLREGPSDPA